MAVHFDNTVNTGHLLTAGAMVIAVVSAAIWVQADLRRITLDQARIEASVESDLASIRADSAAREARIRAVEVAQAAQSSDLRSIQTILGRIERLLEALP